MEIYVKSSFKPGKAEYDGAELEYGVDAYNNLTEALRNAYDYDTIVLLDKSATVKTGELESSNSVTVIGGVADEMEGTQTSQASLTITGTIDDIPLLMQSVSFKLFKSVKLVNAYTGALIGGDIKDVDNRNPDDGNGKWTREYKAAGNAHIGDEAVVNGDITGFNSVTLSDNVTVGLEFEPESGDINATPQFDSIGNRVFGSYKKDGSNKIKNDFVKRQISGTDSEIETIKTAGTFKADKDVKVSGDVLGYGTVNIKGTTIAGGIVRGADETGTEKTTYSTKNDLVTLVEEESQVYKASGNLTSVDSFIGGTIRDYNSVTLTNTNVFDYYNPGTPSANIVRNMESKYSLKSTYTGKYEQAVRILEDESAKKDMTLTSEEKTREEKASGSVTLKIDAKAENGDTMAVGSIGGYAKVTATGFNDSKNFRAGYININGDITGGELKETEKEQAGVSEQDVEEYKASGSVTLKTNVTVAGSITGYNNVTLSDNVTVESGSIDATPQFDSIVDRVFGSYKEDESDKIKNDSVKCQISGTASDIETIKAAGTFKADKGVEVAGYVLGYGTVNIKDTTINGGIIRGEDNTDTEKTTYSTKNDLVTLVEEESQVYKASGNLTSVDSFIGGTIRDYNSVTLTNTNVFENDSYYYPGSQSANIVRNTESKNSLKSTYTGTYEQASRYFNYEVFDISESGMTLTSEEEIRETKAAGSVTLKIDAKAVGGDKMAVGGISGYAKVSATGYDNGKEGDAEIENGIIIDGSIDGGGEFKSTSKSENGTMTTSNTVWKASGSVTLKTNVTVYGDIYGYSTVTLSDSTLVNGNVTAGNVTYDYLAGIQTSQAAGTLKMDDDSFISGSVIGFKSVTAKESHIGGSIIGGDSSGSLRLRAVGMLSASGNLDLNETQVGRDKTIVKIAGFKTVKITDSVINADIDGYETKGTAVTLDEVYLNGKITGVQQVTIKECADILNGYKGTVFDDTVTIGKNVSVDLGGGSDFVLDFGEGTKDKLVLDGIIRLHEAVDFNDIGLEIVSGKGTIAATSDVYNNSVMFSGKNDITMLNLGNTIEYFDGIAAEKADDTKAKAVSIDWYWDGYSNCFIGGENWLGTGDEIDFEDDCDWLKFKAEHDGRVTVNGLGEYDTIAFNGDTLYAGYQNYFDVSAGTEYKICITRNTDNSTSYYLTMEVM